MSSQHCSATRTPRARSTTWCSTRRRRANVAAPRVASRMVHVHRDQHGRDVVSWPTLRPQGATVALRRLERGVTRWHADDPCPGGTSGPSITRGGRAHAQRASRHRYSKRSADSQWRLPRTGQRTTRSPWHSTPADAPLSTRCPQDYAALPRLDVPLLPFGLVGVESLRQMGADGAGADERIDAVAESPYRGESLDAWSSRSRRAARAW